MQRCQASRSVRGAADADIRDAMDRAVIEGPTLITGFAPSPIGLRRSYCERLWEEQQRKFRAEALLQGPPVDLEGDFFGGGYVNDGYVETGYVAT